MDPDCLPVASIPATLSDRTAVHWWQGQDNFLNWEPVQKQRESCNLYHMYQLKHRVKFKPNVHYPVLRSFNGLRRRMSGENDVG
jgi:hypothetical protein